MPALGQGISEKRCFSLLYQTGERHKQQGPSHGFSGPISAVSAPGGSALPGTHPNQAASLPVLKGGEGAGCDSGQVTPRGLENRIE